MSETPQPTQTTGAAQIPPQTRGQEPISPAAHRREMPSEPTGWVGWVVFASMMMILVGSFQAIVGLTALFKDEYYLVTAGGLLVNIDFTTWGWTHLALGLVAVAAGIGLLAGQTWARVVGIAFAMVSAVINMAFIAAYPLWSIIVITLDVFIIYAIAVHGRELAYEGARRDVTA
ncbi:MAG TPA: hypothetical protein VK964_06640 [Nocardioidaceae bacterium]|nr:hypothetical protein [Nocardioidaceae bacterium]